MKLVYLPLLAVNNIGFLQLLLFGLVSVYVSVKILHFHQVFGKRAENKKVIRKVLKLCKL